MIFSLISIIESDKIIILKQSIFFSISWIFNILTIRNFLAGDAHCFPDRFWLKELPRGNDFTSLLGQNTSATDPSPLRWRSGRA